MKQTITLETKEVRSIIAKFLGLKEDDVIPNRYSFAVQNISAEEIEKKLKGHSDDPNI
ncbi:MAG: hypothetical protein Q4F70_05065 [Clostridia bacterium]|nr:hypothetical protein [Clostridia bacterium]